MRNALAFTIPLTVSLVALCMPSRASAIEPAAGVDVVWSAPPSFCPGRSIVPRKGANGCTDGFDRNPGPEQCPEIAQPPPGFCPDGSIVPRKDTKGRTVGFDCVTSPNACVAAGGKCVGITPSSCPGANWADATTQSCGGGVGVGCCLP